MNKKQRDNLYITSIKRLLLDGKNNLPFDNGDILSTKIEETTFNNMHKEVPALSMQVMICNLEGKSTYAGTFYKELDQGQSVHDVLIASEIEKINFILKKEEGFIANVAYHLTETYGSKINSIVSSNLQEYAARSLEYMKQEAKNYLKEVKKSK